MALPSHHPKSLKAWKQLESHFEEISSTTITDHFQLENNRLDQFSIDWEDFYLDFSKNRCSAKTMTLLIDLAHQCGLDQAMDDYFSGKNINVTENRAVLHTALRKVNKAPIFIDGKNILTRVEKRKENMFGMASQIINKQWKGFTGKPIQTVVNIGIGGSDLGPAFVYEALAFYRTRLKVRFLSNVDGDHAQEVLKDLEPETTLFIVVSKTFTTEETLTNAITVRDWFRKSAPRSAITKHFIAVSTNVAACQAFGIPSSNILPMDDWVGGRFSLWSCVGMSICLAIGPQHFDQLLLGAGIMDEHFQHSPFEKNIPVILALISIWYHSFWHADSEAIIPYSQYLRNLPTYLQQSFMESNGKGIDRNGQKVDYQTGAIIWGGSGTNSQHAFFQLIHQGTKLIPADFISFTQSLHSKKEAHQKLLANFIAQTQALMQGKSLNAAIDELKASGYEKQWIERLAPYKVFEGNRPTNTILIKKLTPKTLGSLIAMYEHKIFVKGIVWNIFSFDQWGVELGKQLASKVLSDMQHQVAHSHDSSTSELIQRVL
ncbi:MAG: glucose-6-phosphate isomerase [Flavobacteriaceae bacterium]|nr:glucose-6-phosphate isomerase [Flavobacteriaceae bacterium]